MTASATPVRRALVTAAVLTLAFALAGCDRKPSQPPKPAADAAVPTSAG